MHLAPRWSAMIRPVSPVASLAIATTLAMTGACASTGPSADVRFLERTAHALLRADAGGQVASGKARFWQRSLSGGGIRATTEITFSLDLDGLSPGRHGVAITDAPTCGPTPADSPHFNPRGGIHGALWDVVGHAGDLGNVVVDASGHGSLQIQPITAFNLAEVSGRTLVVYADPDDGATQPDGAAGQVILCGRVELTD